MTRRVRIWRSVGWALTVLPALAATVGFFPVFVGGGDGEKTVSLLGCMLLALALLPLWRQVKSALRSPSAWQVYLLLFCFFFLTDRIAYEMMCVALVGCLSSLLGALCFAIARRAARKEASP